MSTPDIIAAVAIVLVGLWLMFWKRKESDIHIGAKPKAPAPATKDPAASTTATSKDKLVASLMTGWGKVWGLMTLFGWKKGQTLVFYFLVIFACVGVLGGYLRRYHHTGWWEPWGKDPLLFFFFLPLALTIIAGITTLKRKIPNIFAFLLLVIVMIPILKTYENSRWWQDKIAKHEARIEAKRIAAAGPGGEVRIAESDSWSEPVYVNHNRFRYEPHWESGHNRIWVRVNGSRVVEDRKIGPDVQLGDGIETLEFKTDGDHPPVQVIVSIK